MLLRRVIEHAKAQNWTAVALDFVIVVVGVFLGIQLGEWSEARRFEAHEKGLLKELRAETEVAAADMDALRAYFSGVGAAGERALAFLEKEEPCREECWRLVVDFFHASQWTEVTVRRATYDEMRREGLPRSQAVFEAAEALYAQNDSIAFVMNERPAYRNLVRGLIPFEAQRLLWLECHALRDGAEIIRHECPAALTEEESRVVLERIRANADIAPTLTQWVTLAAIASPFIEDQKGAAQRVIDAIDATGS